MQLDAEKRNSAGSTGKWWLCAGCSGLLITSGFIAMTLLLGSKDPNSGRLRLKHVTESNLQSFPEETDFDSSPNQPAQQPPTVLLEPGPDPVSLDDIMTTVGRNPVKKKSEAPIVTEAPRYETPPPSHRPEIIPAVKIDPTNFRHNFKLPGPSVPPFQYVPQYDDSYDSDSSQSNWIDFLQKRLKDVYDLIDTRKVGSEWMELLESVNQSVTSANTSIIMNKLKDLYYNSSSPEISMSSFVYPSRQSLLSNASSLVSFGLLAVDLFLLHNVQQTAFSDEDLAAADKLRTDPEVIALNSLFLSPEKVRQITGRSGSVASPDLSSSTTSETTLFGELSEFVHGSARAIMNLGRAYKKTTRPEQGRSGEPSPLDCIWTLYCRNLDKTARLQGPYGFLAKMNSLGLRLMMGEFPVENALEKVFVEIAQGWGQINCRKLFPRCSAEEARQVVMETALGSASI